MKEKTSKKSPVKKAKARKNTAEKTVPHKDFFIVGIGASAGGLEALKAFFENMPKNPGMAFIIVQHLDPSHKSLLTDLLSSHTKMNVVEIEDGVEVKRNHVYVIPPNKDLKIFHRSLLLSKPTESRGARQPINSFFKSLAEDQKEKAIGIILSGTGTEGTSGLKKILEEGGITLVQDPKTALFAGMPESAILAKVADCILAVEKMPSQLNHLHRKTHLLNKSQTDTSDIPSNLQLKAIYQLIRKQSAYDFSEYKTNTIIRRITKRMTLAGFDKVEDYLSFLQNNPVEIEKLYKDFFIGVTSFFRDKEVYKIIEKKAIPYLMGHCTEKQEIRVWVCGCSSGEEAYSLAILFKEALEKTKQYIKVTLFASDIDKEAIEFARNGKYTENSIANVSSVRISRYFIKKQSSYELKKEIREMIVFAQHDVIKDPPFSKMDMISCRNLLIYMNSELQKRILSTFHYSLNDEGLLLLGTSESVGDNLKSFSSFDLQTKIFKNNNEKIPKKLNLNYEFNNLIQKLEVGTNTLSKKTNISGLIERILLGKYAPPSVIIDKNNDAIYFSGNIGRYLEPPSGEARFNVLEMAKKGIKNHLEAAIKKARNNKIEIQEKNITVLLNDHYESINLVVKPISSQETKPGAFIIIFERLEAEQEKDDGKHIKHGLSLKKKENILEKELQITKQHLQSAIDELESTNEDLRSTNEEYQSSNEELQSTNEELETSREELQSLNEELITVNSELSGKIEQLSQTNDDLNNLLSSIEVATVFLDRDLKIKRFTPTATKIFNLIPSDVERPVTHLSTNIIYKGLVEDVKNTLKKLAVKTADVQAFNGTWYHMRILPYRTAENIIEGLLLTFVDITEQKATEENLKKTNEHLSLIMENLPAIPFTCPADSDIHISFIGNSCEKLTGFLPQQFIGNKTFWISRVHPDDKKKIRHAFQEIEKTNSSDVPFRWKCLNGKYKEFINYLRYAKAEEGRPAYIVGMWQEVSPERKQKNKHE